MADAMVDLGGPFVVSELANERNPRMGYIRSKNALPPTDIAPGVTSGVVGLPKSMPGTK